MNVIRRTYKYRLYPTNNQEEVLDRWLMLCRRLYNAMLEQRQIAYSKGVPLTWIDQKRELPALKQAFPEYGQIGSHVLQDVAHRLQSSFDRLFKGTGYPKFLGRNRYESFTFPDQAGCSPPGFWLVIAKARCMEKQQTKIRLRTIS